MLQKPGGMIRIRGGSLQVQCKLAFKVCRKREKNKLPHLFSISFIIEQKFTIFCVGSIRLRVLSSPKKFSQHYNIHEELLLQICDGDPNLFCNKGLALIDANDPSYMTKNEQINRMCAQVAKDSGNKYAVDEYSKVARYFGSM
jgi:hypothetical protein